MADGGAGLVFQEGTAVQRDGCGTRGDLGIWDDAFVEPLRRITSLIRGNGGVPGIQLMHAGRKGRMSTPMEGRVPLRRKDEDADWDEWEPQSPSPIPFGEGASPPREMTSADIDRLVRSFIAAAGRADRAGYDVAEIHSGHGYLLHQFLSPETNRRTDRYGGSFENRIRLLLDITEGVRSVWPDDKPLFVRLSAVDDVGWELDDTRSLAKRLTDRGVDVIDCSSGGIKASPMDRRAALSYGYQVGYASEVRRRTGCRTMTVGLIVHADHAERIVADGEADLVALGRELLYNPNWPLDAAVKLGADDAYSVTTHRMAYWLRKRADAWPEILPSTVGPQTLMRGEGGAVRSSG
jgi:2,4-dienoyl-CoA reductase-like NADH-dependent reductase (Old Yellow Enzyme family)